MADVLATVLRFKVLGKTLGWAEAPDSWEHEQVAKMLKGTGVDVEVAHCADRSYVGSRETLREWVNTLKRKARRRKP